jgi:DNA-binding protein HU-beta
MHQQILLLSLNIFIMNKGDLIDKIAGKANLKKADAASALNAFLESVNEALKAGDRITLVGFGTFSVAYRPSRKGINPSNQQVIEISDKVSAKFKAGKELSNGVDNSALKDKLKKEIAKASKAKSDSKKDTKKDTKKKK